MVRTSKTILKKSGESGPPSLDSGLRGNAFSFLPLIMMLAVGLSFMAFIMLRYIPSMPIFWIFFYHKLMLNFVESFFCICLDDHVVSLLPFVTGLITLIDLDV